MFHKYSSIILLQGEARRHKHKKVPAQFSVNIPVSTLPVTYAAPSAPAVQYSSPSSDTQYYTYSYPSTSQISYSSSPQFTYSSTPEFPQYTYPSKPFYENTYSYTYPNSYPAETSSPSITINASGPFYRETQHTDNTQEKSTTGIPPKEPSSPTTSIERTASNRRENIITQDKEQITPSAIQT